MRHLLLLAVLTVQPPQIATAQTSIFSQLIVFGDSLSDTGNFFASTGLPAPPYWQGRFSNGPNWADQIANHLGLPSANTTNRAVGFATTTDVLQLQVSPYLASVPSADPAALHVFWAGANDLFVLAENPGMDPVVVINTAMNNTASSLLGLISSGAQNILVANLPDLSGSPFVQEFGNPVFTASMLALTRTYNRALARTLQTLESSTGVTFLKFDAFALMSSLISNPYSGGFRTVDTRALSSTGVLTPHVDAYLFWDHVHPTTKGHSFVMGATLASLGILWGDVNADGQLDAADSLALATSFGPCVPGTAADMDGNGIVDANDQNLLRIVLR